MRSEHGDLYKVNIPEEWRSRGTGEQVQLQEATVFDFMPQIIGSRFAGVENLKRRVHFWGDHLGVPYLGLEDAYSKLAQEELQRGRLDESLDAYKRSLHYATVWVQSIAKVQHMALLNPAELDRMNLGARFGDLEKGLLQTIVRQDVAFNGERYASFASEVRRLEKKRFQLHQLFFFGKSMAYEEVEAPGIKDPQIGQEYIETCVRMGRFKEASWIARELGLKTDESRYLILAANEPKDNPRVEYHIENARRRYDRDY